MLIFYSHVGILSQKWFTRVVTFDLFGLIESGTKLREGFDIYNDNKTKSIMRNRFFPVLFRGLANKDDSLKASIYAHIAWAKYMLSQDQDINTKDSEKIENYFTQAKNYDPDNIYLLSFRSYWYANFYSYRVRKIDPQTIIADMNRAWNLKQKGEKQEARFIREFQMKIFGNNFSHKNFLFEKEAIRVFLEIHRNGEPLHDSYGSAIQRIFNNHLENYSGKNSLNTMRELVRTVEPNISVKALKLALSMTDDDNGMLKKAERLRVIKAVAEEVKGNHDIALSAYKALALEVDETAPPSVKDFLHDAIENLSPQIP